MIFIERYQLPNDTAFYYTQLVTFLVLSRTFSRQYQSEIKVDYNLHLQYSEWIWGPNLKESRVLLLMAEPLFQMRIRKDTLSSIYIL